MLRSCLGLNLKRTNLRILHRKKNSLNRALTLRYFEARISLEKGTIGKLALSLSFTLSITSFAEHNGDSTLLQDYTTFKLFPLSKEPRSIPMTSQVC